MSALRDCQAKQFFESVNSAYAALREDPKQWQEELDERTAWDATLSDGLDD
jgi:hypothetical protein